MINITLKDGSKKSFPKGISVLRFLFLFIKEIVGEVWVVALHFQQVSKFLDKQKAVVTDKLKQSQ